MQTIEIPREHWAHGLDQFTTIHEGWLVSLDVLGPEIGALPQVDSLPLLGISADRSHHDDTIAVSVGRSGTDQLTHIVHGVTHIFVERTDEGADAALQIQSADGTTTIMRFRVAARPETVDGVMCP
jgi:Family of unknown function (DUF5335)